MIPSIAFGATGHRSSRTILGAAAFGTVTQQQADATLELALGYGVNHVDTAASYGESEKRIGSWIRRHGKGFFLATKTGERTAQAAKEELHRSLENLGVDQVDLIQLHNLVEPNAWQTALGPGGALEALIEARDSGLVKYIGVTGHGLAAPASHLRALERFSFDSVLFPFSYILSKNEEYWADAERLVETCTRRNIAIQTIKAIVRSPWGSKEANRATWYEPLEEQAEIDLAVQWVLGHQSVFLNTVGDVHVVPKVFDSAKRYYQEAVPTAPPAQAMEAQLKRMTMSHLFTDPWC